MEMLLHVFKTMLGIIYTKQPLEKVVPNANNQPLEKVVPNAKQLR